MQTEDSAESLHSGTRRANAKSSGKRNPAKSPAPQSDYGLGQVIVDHPLFSGNRQTELFGEEWRAKLKALRPAE